MNIGFFCFDNEKEYEKKQAMFEKTECTEIYAGGYTAFGEWTDLLKENAVCIGNEQTAFFITSSTEGCILNIHTAYFAFQETDCL